MKAETLLTELTALTTKNMEAVQHFQSLSDEALTFRKSPDSWNVLECIEHLNRYGDFYLPELKKRLESSRHKPAPSFKSGILGSYFAKSMLPGEKLKKMKTFRSMNPVFTQLSRSVLDTFINQQQTTFQLLQASAAADLTRIKTSISISPLIKLRLGDTLCVVIYHNFRHVAQAKNILKFHEQCTGKKIAAV